MHRPPHHSRTRKLGGMARRGKTRFAVGGPRPPGRDSDAAVMMFEQTHTGGCVLSTALGSPRVLLEVDALEGERERRAQWGIFGANR